MIFNLEINISLVIVGLAIAISLILGAIVFLSNIRSYTNIAFAIFSILSISWNVLNFLFYQPHDSTAVALLLLRLQVFFAIWYCFALLILFYIFPKEKTDIKKWYKFGILPLTIIVSFMTLTPLVFKQVTKLDSLGRVASVENNWGVIIFGITVTTILGIAFVNLVNKFQKSYKEEKKKLSLILIGATTTFIFHIIFNMILPSFFEISKFTEFGALFTLPFSALTAYAIIKFKLFNVKVVSAELLAFILWIFIFIRILIAENLREQFINSIMFVVVVIVGIFLIRSVLREVDQREKLAKLANELETSNEKLKSLDTLKTEFLSLASHQLRSPLTAIKGYSSMLLEGSYGVLADTTQREAIERIFQSSTALAKTVEDFLNVSKIEQGGMKYEFDEIDISKFAEEIVNELLVSAESRGLKLTFSTIDKGPYIARVDANKIRQVLLNFIDNGIKYTKEGFVSVRVGRDSDSKKIIFSVEDSGMGMTPEIKSQLFQKFSRGNGARMNTGGSGLGLYLAKEIVRAHNGTVNVSSPGLGKGSTFYVTLPALG